MKNWTGILMTSILILGMAGMGLAQGNDNHTVSIQVRTVNVIDVDDGGLGIALWFLWNLLIFNDPLYFILGPFSAHAQQLQLETAGDLPTKSNLFLSTKVYLYALVYNSYAFTALMGTLGAVGLWIDKKVKPDVLVKGQDWEEKGVVGREFVESYGGKVELAPLAEGNSTTNTIEKIKSL